jgi:hypothetical protein
VTEQLILKKKENERKQIKSGTRESSPICYSGSWYFPGIATRKRAAFCCGRDLLHKASQFTPPGPRTSDTFTHTCMLTGGYDIEGTTLINLFSCSRMFLRHLTPSNSKQCSYPIMYHAEVHVFHSKQDLPYERHSANRDSE